MDDWNKDLITKNILDYGKTDLVYFLDHYDRFISTIQFSKDHLRDDANILDVGSHWLHFSYLLRLITNANIVGIDNGISINHNTVINIAKHNNINLCEINRFDNIQDIPYIKDNSIDILYFCEILEHLAFNPINLWKVLYNKLKNNSIIILTTPNACYYENIIEWFIGIHTGIIGINVDEIFKHGTNGHHWKLFNIKEIFKYFEYMSQDFIIDQIDFRSYRQKNSISIFEDKLKNMKMPEKLVSTYKEIIIDHQKNNMYPFEETIFVKINVQKINGFNTISPWTIH